MIVFDLRCGGGHVFEAWFGSTGDYDNQRERGLVQCPVCETRDVAKAAMAPRSSGKKGDPSATEVKSMLGALADAQKRMLDTSDYVGERFADEARAIHLGDADARSIHGQASRADAIALLDEGIKVAPLPFPVIPSGRQN